MCFFVLTILFFWVVEVGLCIEWFREYFKESVPTNRILSLRRNLWSFVTRCKILLGCVELIFLIMKTTHML